METFSLSLFLASGWGKVVGSLVMIAATGVGIACALFITSKLEGRPGIVRFGGFMAGLLGVPLALLLMLPGSMGEVTRLSIAEVDGERVVFGGFTWYASGGRGAGRRVGAIRRFRVHDGSMLGSLKTGGTLFSSKCKRVSVFGRARICLEGDLEIRDRVTLEKTGELSDALDERYGAEGYRVVRIEDGRLEVERRDGVAEAIGLDALGISAEPLETFDLMATCSAGARRKDTEVEGLLRATPCLMSEGQLVLHRESAFGDGAHLVSLQESGSTRWTLPLDPWVDPDSEELRLLSPRRDEGEIAFWLLREKVSLVEIVVDASSGTPIRADVVF